VSRRAILAVVAVLASARAGAEEGYVATRYRLTPLLSVAWEGARPLGSLRDDIDRDSTRGGQLEARFGVVPHLSLGLAASWNWFSRIVGQETVSVGDATITGPAYRRNQVFTVRATGHWYLTRGRFQPYVGGGVGGAWADTYRTIGSVALTSHAIGLAADPQVGFLLTIRNGLALHAQARWQYTRLGIGDVREAQWVAVGVGLAGY
jgi:opacity protein-like surface antigen